MKNSTIASPKADESEACDLLREAIELHRPFLGDSPPRGAAADAKHQQIAQLLASAYKSLAGLDDNFIKGLLSGVGKNTADE